MQGRVQTERYSISNTKTGPGKAINIYITKIFDKKSDGWEWYGIILMAKSHPLLLVTGELNSRGGDHLTSVFNERSIG